jgi:hypothetical protein
MIIAGFLPLYRLIHSVSYRQGNTAAGFSVVASISWKFEPPPDASTAMRFFIVPPFDANQAFNEYLITEGWITTFTFITASVHLHATRVIFPSDLNLFPGAGGYA